MVKYYSGYTVLQLNESAYLLEVEETNSFCAEFLVYANRAMHVSRTAAGGNAV
jgi:hypothetical protein